MLTGLDAWTKILSRRAVLDTCIYLAQEPDRELIMDIAQRWIDSGFEFTREQVERIADGQMPDLPQHTLMAAALRRAFAKQYDFAKAQISEKTERNNRSMRRRARKSA